MIEQQLTHCCGRVLKRPHQRCFPSVKGIDVGIVLEQSRRKINIVVFDGQVQSIAVLEFDVISPDAGLESGIKVFA